MLRTGTASTSNLSMIGESVPAGQLRERPRATLSRTSCAATSRDFSRTNCTTIDARRPRVVVLRSSSMPSIVLTASSMHLGDAGLHLLDARRPSASW